MVGEVVESVEEASLGEGLLDFDQFEIFSDEVVMLGVWVEGPFELESVFVSHSQLLFVLEFKYRFFWMKINFWEPMASLMGLIALFEPFDCFVSCFCVEGLVGRCG